MCQDLHNRFAVEFNASLAESLIYPALNKHPLSLIFYYSNKSGLTIY